ncbi:MAG: ribosome silencing factor [bacterium]
MDTLQLAQSIAREALDTKAKDLQLLDLRDLVSYTDFFILCTGTSDRHVKSIADRVHLKLKRDQGKLPVSYEGLQEGRWVLLDYGDVVLHVFQDEQRKFYGLDEMWADAPRLAVPGEKPPAQRKAAKRRPTAKPGKRKAAAKRAPAKRKSPPKKKRRP